MAPNLRSREIPSKSPVKTLDSAPIDPPTPSLTDSPASLASSAPSLPLGLDPSVPAPPRRRSLRLAGVAAPSPPSVNQSSSKRRSSAKYEVTPVNLHPWLSLRLGNAGERSTRRRVEDGGVDDAVLEKRGDHAQERRRFSAEDEVTPVDLHSWLSLGLGESGERSTRRIEDGGVDDVVLEERGDHAQERRFSAKDEVTPVDLHPWLALRLGDSGERSTRRRIEDGGVDDVVLEKRGDHAQERRRFSAEEKGKATLQEREVLIIDEEEEEGVEIGAVDVKDDLVPVVGKEDGGTCENGDSLARRNTVFIDELRSLRRREADRRTALRVAAKFAIFKPEEEKEGDDEEVENVGRDERMVFPHDYVQVEPKKCQDQKLDFVPKKAETVGAKIQWMRSGRQPLGRMAPSLQNLCLIVLSQNFDDIESLEGIPDTLKYRLLFMLCSTRNMSCSLLRRLVGMSPWEIRLIDFSWATEGDFQVFFTECDIKKLKVLQLDLCGRCMSDYVLRDTLARSMTSLPSLTTLSLKGAYRLSDVGLNALVSSAPFLSSINLSHCSLITSKGIVSLAEKLVFVLQELYIDDCHNINVVSILPALKNLKHLAVLSVAGIESVSDDFVRELVSASGGSIKELFFARCQNLTNASIKIIGQNCPQLRVLDLQHLNRLKDSALEHLANGCRSIEKFRLCRNEFSDQAIAAFLESSGGSVIELSLNNVKEVAEHTALAISRCCCLSLQRLDLSFCRYMTDEALGRIVDSCTNLKFLRLFGCTQVSNVFLDGHSNPLLKIIGLKGCILNHMEYSSCMQDLG